jgi:hypothetical protein
MLAGWETNTGIVFSGFFMNKFACRKKMTIDIFLIFCHDILAMILFRILTKSKEVHVLICFSYRTKTVHFSLRDFFVTVGQ